MIVTALKIALVSGALAGPAGTPQDQGADEIQGIDGIQGLAGDLFVSEGDRDSSDMVLPMQVAVGDRIQLIYSYTVLPGSTPESVEGESDDEGVVKYQEARAIRTVPLITGEAKIAGFFVAEKPGEITITFRATPGGQVTRVVTVTEPEGR